MGNAKPDAETVAFIELYLLCKEFNSLPRPGGVMDQDSYLMYGLACVQRQVAAYQKWQSDHPPKK